MSWRDTTRSIDQWVAPPTSMYSMKRTSAPCAAPELEQRHQLVVVHAADHHRVDLESGEERCGRRDARAHAVQLVVARQGAEAVGVQRVEAHGQPVQPGGLQRLGVRREQNAVGRHGEIADAGSPRQPRDQVRDVAPQQRFAAGQPDLVHAERR